MLDKTVTDWRAAALELEIEGRAFVDGRYVDALSGQTRPTINPANGQQLANVALCGTEDADRAVQGARQAFESGNWSEMAPGDRKMIMIRWAELIEQHAGELALLESLDVGKPISDTLNVDVPSAVRTIRWSGEAIDKVYDQISPTGPGTLALIQRLPLGVVTAIVPWNFPLSTTAWKLAPSLATGNSVILKPASNTPLTAIRLAGLAAEAGLPDSVLQVLPGPGGSMGKHLAMHMGIDGMTFTGSTPVGKLLMQYSGLSNLKRTFLELGGKSPNIVFADADLKAAVKGAQNGIFYGKGEVCAAGSRLLVEASVHDEVVEQLVERCKRLEPGDPLVRETRLGAVVSKAQQETVMSYVEAGKKEATLVAGGNARDVNGKGYFVEATVFDDAKPGMKIVDEEIFGPVLAVMTFDDVDEGISLANQTDFGLAAGIWTKDIQKAHRVAQRIRAGTVWINTYNMYDPAAPFGGYKASGYGRDLGRESLDGFLETKSVWVAL